MAIIKLPVDHSYRSKKGRVWLGGFVSPQDGTPVRMDADSKEISDDSGNRYSLYNIVGTRFSNAARKYFDRVFPKG